MLLASSPTMLFSPVITIWHFQDAFVVMNEPLLIKYYYVKSIVYILSWLSGKESTCKAEDMGSIPGSERSPGEENGNPLQYSCLGNLVNRGVRKATVHWVIRAENDLATKSPPHSLH